MKDNCSTLYPNEAVARKVSEYSDQCSLNLPEQLLQFHDWVLETQERSHYTISLLQARWLTWIARASGAKRVLEIGTYVGFSLATWAYAIGSDGQATGLERSATYAQLAREQLQRFGCMNTKIIVGDAAQLWKGPRLETLQADEPYDMIFIDAQKSDYPRYLRTILDRSLPGQSHRLLRPGGLVIGDNVLRLALVVDQSDENPATKTLLWQTENCGRQDMPYLDEFNRIMHSHPRLESVLLPVFDGLGMGRLLD